MIQKIKLIGEVVKVSEQYCRISTHWDTDWLLENSLTKQEEKRKPSQEDKNTAFDTWKLRTDSID
jgi:hypothetical protein